MPIQANFSPTFSQGVLNFSNNTFTCVQNANCNLPGQPTDQPLGFAGSVFVLLGLFIVLAITAVVYRVVIKKHINSIENEAAKNDSSSSAQKENKVEPEPDAKAVEEVTPVTSSNKKQPIFKPKKPEQALPTTGKRKANDFAALAGSNDVLSTQLDLARVYVDMGSQREAKKILKNIIEKGSEEQKLVAKKIMEKLEAEVV